MWWSARTVLLGSLLARARCPQPEGLTFAYDCAIWLRIRAGAMASAKPFVHSYCDARLTKKGSCGYLMHFCVLAGPPAQNGLTASMRPRRLGVLREQVCRH